jgi:DNA polymerase-3 subunit gamma/tau
LFQVSRGDLNLLEISESEAASLREQSSLADVETLTRILDVFTDAEIRLREASSKKILLEVSLLKAIQARKAVSIDSVLKRLQDLRRESHPGAAPEPLPAQAAAPSKHVQPESKSKTREAPPRSAATAGAGPDLEELWTKLIDSIAGANRFTHSYLLEAHPVSLLKGVFTIGFPPASEDHIDLVNNERNQALLQTKLSELGHPNVQIRFVKAAAPARPVSPAPEAPTAAPAPPPELKPTPPIARTAPSTGSASSAKEKPVPVPFNKADFKNDPLIQKALEIFKGQIVEVRA